MPEVAHLQPVATWLRMLDRPHRPLLRQLRETYGDEALLPAPVALLRRTLSEFLRVFGNREVFVLRSTGRVNLLGMHVDHRGGSVNPIAIKEAFFVVEPRADDVVLLHDVNGEKFPPESFVISECLPKGCKVTDWDAWCHDELPKRKGNSRITFSNYFRAGVLYFQNRYVQDDGTPAPKFCGMNVMIGNNVPPAAGLSTSSCLVVAAGLAILHCNGLTMDRMEFCEHCGWAEWYVGTRGGFGDHAAICMGQPGALSHITSFPFSLRAIPFPKGYRAVLADSLHEARKQAGARQGFNFPLAAYQMGLLLAKANYPQYADRIQHLRDINHEHLGVSEAEIYRIIRSLPERLSRAEALARLPAQHPYLENLFRSHTEPPEGYPVRQVCMYGITECVRSTLIGPRLLEQGDIAGFGRLISAHHDGDRVTSWRDGQMVPFDNSYPDAKLDALIAAAEAGDPAAHLWLQPGGYRASVPGIDQLVDLSLQVPGVVGAGLVGAGLGGSMIALVEEGSAEKLVAHLAEHYYQAQGLPVKAEIVAPVGGAAIIST